MTQRILERKLRILKSELRMIQSYYDESKELLAEYEQEWLQDFAHFRKKFSAAPPKQEEVKEEDVRSFEIIDSIKIEDHNHGFDEPSLSATKSSAPEWAKKVFRKIAMIIHPDKTSNPQKDSKLFLKATESFESGDYEALLSIAVDLGVSLDMETPALGIMLQKKIDALKVDVSELETSLPWVWGESFGLHEVRVPLLKINLAQENISTNEGELLKAIQEREKNSGSR